MTDEPPARPKPSARKTPKVPRRITETYLHNAGLHYLQRFATSTGNFRRVMMRKIDKSCRHHTEQSREDSLRLLDALIEKFTRSGLLNDEAYTRGMVSSLRRRGESSRKIENRLSAKGVQGTQIRASLQTARDDDGQDDFSAALRYARRRRLGPFRAPGHDEDAKDTEHEAKEAAKERANKEMSVMARGGFSYEIAGKILRMSADEAEDALSTGARLA